MLEQEQLAGARSKLEEAKEQIQSSEQMVRWLNIQVRAPERQEQPVLRSHIKRRLWIWTLSFAVCVIVFRLCSQCMCLHPSKPFMRTQKGTLVSAAKDVAEIILAWAAGQ